ncbi:MAG TPA: hypothetical protein DCW90_18300 [Lachnospiraceae bacterium]|nr:hypothetical protein [Lachnospiraceae bacterium]
MVVAQDAQGDVLEAVAQLAMEDVAEVATADAQDVQGDVGRHVKLTVLVVVPEVVVAVAKIAEDYALEAVLEIVTVARHAAEVVAEIAKALVWDVMAALAVPAVVIVVQVLARVVPVVLTVRLVTAPVLIVARVAPDAPPLVGLVAPDVLPIVRRDVPQAALLLVLPPVLVVAPVVVLAVPMRWRRF